MPSYSNVTIEKIQRKLRDLGLYLKKIDNIYGPDTKYAIKMFQKTYSKLICNGIAGKKTLALLLNKPLEVLEVHPGGTKFSKFPLQKDVLEFYGEFGKNQTKIILPYEMKIAWDLGKKINGFTCHKKVSESIMAIFEDTLEHYGLDEIQRLKLDLFGGCFNVRKMRGGSQYSMHSWGIAIDLDPLRNKLKWDHKKANFARPEYVDFWDIVEKHGAISLGRERDFDWMHFQFARL